MMDTMTTEQQVAEIYQQTVVNNKESEVQVGKYAIQMPYEWKYYGDKPFYYDTYEEALEAVKKEDSEKVVIAKCIALVEAVAIEYKETKSE
jgi:hypothetical protein